MALWGGRAKRQKKISFSYIDIRLAEIKVILHTCVQHIFQHVFSV